VDIMRRALQGVVVAGVLAIGGLTGLGTSSAQAQGFGGYPGGGAYCQGYPGGGGYGPGYVGSGGGIGINLGIGGYPAPLIGGYGSGYSVGGFRSGYGSYSHHHHHHQHHRGCGHGY